MREATARIRQIVRPNRKAATVRDPAEKLVRIRPCFPLRPNLTADRWSWHVPCESSHLHVDLGHIVLRLQCRANTNSAANPAATVADTLTAQTAREWPHWAVLRQPQTYSVTL